MGRNEPLDGSGPQDLFSHVTAIQNLAWLHFQGLIHQNHIKTHANGAFERLLMQQESKGHEGFSPRTAKLRGWDASEAGDRWSLWYPSAVSQRRTRPRVVSLSD
jgi:hypothetical protein